MKNLKLVTLSIILLSQVSLVSAMKQADSEKQFVEWQKKDLAKRIDAVINAPAVLNNLIVEYCGVLTDYKLLGERLLKAIEKEDFKLMQEVVVQQGAYVNFTNQNGQTPLICAILNLSHRLDPEFDLYRFIKFLIQQGANINQPDFEGNTPLMHAVKSDVKDPVRFLKLFINKETNLNLQNTFGNTALIIRAAKFGDRDSILTLIESGANVNLTNQPGETAFDCYKRGDKDVTLLLMPEIEKKRLEEVELQKALQKISKIEEKERKEKEDKKRLELLQERDRLLVQRAKEDRQIQKEEERLREQRAQEALAQIESQPQEENWEEEQPGEAVEGSGEADESWENSEFQD